MSDHPPNGVTSLSRSFAACREVVRCARSNFTLAFRLLPQEQRRGMEALYAWMRLTDDLADGPNPIAHKQQALAAWRRATLDSRWGASWHPIMPAVHATINRFGIPLQHFEDVLHGVEIDLHPREFATFAELEQYCRCVATAVGLACLRIWGVNDPAAHPPAHAAGMAFQLTNILRDLGEDLNNGRVYLPREDWQRLNCPPRLWHQKTPAFQQLVRWQAARAATYFQAAAVLPSLLPQPARIVFGSMYGNYELLLAAIRRQPLTVLTRRLRVPGHAKIATLLRMAICG